MNSRRRRTRGGDAETKLDRAIDQLDASIERSAEMKAVVAEIKEVVKDVKEDGGDPTEAMVEVFNHLVPDPRPYFDDTVLDREQAVVDALAPEGATKAESVAKINTLFEQIDDLYYDIGVELSQYVSKAVRIIRGRNDQYTAYVVLHYVITMRRDEARKTRSKLVADAEYAKTEPDMQRIVNTAVRWGTAARILSLTFDSVIMYIFTKFAWDVITDGDRTAFMKTGWNGVLQRKTMEFVEAVNGTCRKFIKNAFSI
jgi:hypothetical protein